MGNLARYALSIGAATALLTACGAPQPPIGSPGAVTQTSTAYQVLLRFGSHPFLESRGRHPIGGLIDVNGTLYATTTRGGSSDDGVVFSISSAGTEKILHSFRGGSDGAQPQAGLIDVHGTLYGTTLVGGGSGCYSSEGCGTVFSVTAAGVETVLHRFAGPSDGALPRAGVIDVNGALYGTTSDGAAPCGCGTVYRIGTTGKETTLYRFTGSPNGNHPWGTLVYVHGLLYGTTFVGGTQDWGTVFSISTKGKEKLLYAFIGNSDDSDAGRPTSGLTNVNGTLYGTTQNGGGGNCQSNYGELGCGAIYAISTMGSESLLHRFSGGADGALPYGGLTNVNGTLYGTTQYGGGGNCRSTYDTSGCGTIFEKSTTGSESVVHSFSSGTDGAVPYAGLFDAGGTLYGTTSIGGAGRCGGGCGTIFALTP
jgi:uncharacterized repeat protein (TIGR03803 family)